MSDIQAYDDSDTYNRFQALRPDYTGAINCAISVTKRYSRGLERIALADFCAGTGTNTHRFANEVGGITRATLIDINAQFLATALLSNINARQIDAHCQDILTVQLDKTYDLVFSFFAYHHVHDVDKPEFLKLARDCLLPHGKLILAEIYLGTKERSQMYYDKLFDSLPSETKSPELKQFLTQTANSSDFEFKVEKCVADKHLRDAGFEICEQQKIWPLDFVDSNMHENEGTFVQVFELRHK